MNDAIFSHSDDDFGHLAGAGFGELERDELREDRGASLLSSGFICTVTAECNC